LEFAPPNLEFGIWNLEFEICSMASIDKSNTFYAKDRAAWRKWLDKNHLTAPGVWLIYYKKGSGKTRVEYADAVEEALCFGWIDSTLNPIDEHSYMQLFTPRKPKSGWSKINKDRVEKLIAAGLMTPAGLEKIEVAKHHGTWHKLDGIESFALPPELEKAFTANKKAKKFFDTLSNTNKKYILYHVNGAKKAETKAQRIANIIAAANEGKMLDRYLPQSKK
jgi:uncharacterized protein YdeI (YjbR/CyaY-like superfamily)